MLCILQKVKWKVSSNKAFQLANQINTNYRNEKWIDIEDAAMEL